MLLQTTLEQGDLGELVRITQSMDERFLEGFRRWRWKELWRFLVAQGAAASAPRGAKGDAIGADSAGARLLNPEERARRVRAAAERFQLELELEEVLLSVLDMTRQGGRELISLMHHSRDAEEKEQRELRRGPVCYKVCAVVGHRFFSVFDGRTEYRVGVPVGVRPGVAVLEGDESAERRLAADAAAASSSSTSTAADGAAAGGGDTADALDEKSVQPLTPRAKAKPQHISLLQKWQPQTQPQPVRRRRASREPQARISVIVPAGDCGTAPSEPLRPQSLSGPAQARGHASAPAAVRGYFVHETLEEAMRCAFPVESRLRRAPRAVLRVQTYGSCWRYGGAGVAYEALVPLELACRLVMHSQ
jgi:hypothetical protein